MTEEQDIPRKIAFGAQVESFIQSPIGKYLIGRAEKERHEALEEMANTSLENIAALAQAQRKVRIADSFQAWLAEAIQEGWEAERQFIESEDGGT